MMHSSFLNWISLGLGAYSAIMFLKMIIQFGLPGHPARFTLYLTCFCACAYLNLRAFANLELTSPLFFIKWRALPLVAGSLALLIQMITIVGQFGMIQQKIISRMPLIAGLLVFAFFPNEAEWFLGSCLVAGGIFLSISVGKARYQKRMYFKMLLFLSFFAISTLKNNFWLETLGELFLFPALFYFYILQQAFGVSALIENFQRYQEGTTK